MKRIVVRDQAGNVALYAVLLLVVVAVVVLGAWRITASKKTKTGTSPTPAGTALTATASGSQTSKGLTTGTDNASLNKDLNNIGGSLNEGTRNLQSASNATNDESQVVNVPTN